MTQCSRNGLVLYQKCSIQIPASMPIAHKILQLKLQGI